MARVSAIWLLICAVRRGGIMGVVLMAIPQQHGTEGAGHEDDNGGLYEAADGSCGSSGSMVLLLILC